MLCRNPFISGGAAFPCGQCMPCRFNRRRLWTHRIMLESMLYKESCFLTLSYEDCYLPVIGSRILTDGTELAVGTLRAKDLQNWLKRLRKAIEPFRIRFFAVGEYGDISWRPHYHVVLFGFDTCKRGRTLRRGFSSRALWNECCDRCRLVGDTWGFGDVDLGTLTSDSASYCAEYTIKKLTAPDDRRLYLGNCKVAPEFARMSLRPGIGVDAMWDVASEMMRYRLDERSVDVPSTLRHGKREMALGRLLTRKLRKMVGRDESAPEEKLVAISEELRPLREAARVSTVNPSFKKHVVEAGSGRVAQIEAKNAIFKRRKVL